MDPLSVSASIVALLEVTSTVLGYLSDVKEGPKELQRIRLEISSVLTILFVLQDQANQANLHDSFSATLRSLNVPDGPFSQFFSAMELLASRLAPAEGWKKVRKALKWHFEKDEIQKTLDTIERHKSLFSLARQNDHIALSKAIKDDIETARREISEIKIGIHNSQIDELRQKIREWLSAPDPSSNYIKALRDRYEATGSWFLATDTYSNWLSTPTSLVWMHGIPGCGKTVLSSTVIQNISKYCESRTGSIVLYFYFDFNDIEKQKYAKMLRSLVTQLCSQCANTPKVLESLYSSCRNGEQQPTDSSLLAALCQMIGQFEDVYVILDALDECLERQELLASIQQLIRCNDGRIHILTTSRMEKDIEESMEPFTNNREKIRIRSMLIDNDIRSYVRGRLQTDPTLKRWQKQPKMQKEIEDTLMDKTDGMFRWAACQLDSLRNCMNLPGLRKTLASLPKTLDDTYTRILCNIDEGHFQYAFKILQWLAYSARPLELRELSEVIAIDIEGSPRFDPEDRFPEPRDILTICSSLISLQNDAVEDEHGDSDSIIVGLAHLSVKEFLSSDSILRGEVKRYGIQEIKANALICNDCIAYLLGFDGVCSIDFHFLLEYPLAMYAAVFWAEHAQMAERDLDFNPLLLTEFLLTEGHGFSNSIRIYDPDIAMRDAEKWTRKSSSDHPQPLYYASMAGLQKTVQMLLDKGVDVDAESGRGRSALQAASSRGHDQTVQMLLAGGANINKCGELWGSALHAGSMEGHEQVVQMLLEKGADVNILDVIGESPLHRAWKGPEQVVRILLENGADVNASDNDGYTPLHWPSLGGLEQVVQVLMEKGADINASDNNGYTPLFKASQGGQRQVVRMLLEHGADVNVSDHDGCTTLYWASQRGQEQVVQILLEKGADVNAPDRSGYTPLHSALRGGHEQVAQLLLENGADVNASASYGYTPLHLALRGNHEHVAQLLLEKGADVNASTSYGCTPLYDASERGYKQVVQILLEKGANVNASDYDGYSPLSKVSPRGHEQLVQMLLEHGANVNESDGYSRALDRALRVGHDRVVQMLLDKGARKRP